MGAAGQAAGKEDGKCRTPGIQRWEQVCNWSASKQKLVDLASWRTCAIRTSMAAWAAVGGRSPAKGTASGGLCKPRPWQAEMLCGAAPWFQCHNYAVLDRPIPSPKRHQ